MSSSDPWIDEFLAIDITCPELLSAAKTVKSWCADFAIEKPGNRLLVLAGVPGTGKTHIAKRVAAWARAVACHLWSSSKFGWSEAPPLVSYASWPTVAEDLSLEREREYREADLLVLDDVGAEADRYRSGQPIESLRKILSARDGKWTIVTTNGTPAVWLEQWDARVADRLMRGSVIVPFTKVPSHAIWRRQQ